MDHLEPVKYSILDSRVIGQTRGARLSLGTVQKEPRGSLLTEEKPWEVRFDNLYANTVFDQEEQVYKCWYNPFIIDEVTSNTSLEQRASLRYRPKAREMGVCYAISKDGIVWQKPDLGIIEFDGSSRNNLVMRDVHGVGVYWDPNDANPQRRYKAFSHNGVATSPDGLHWSQVVPCPEMEAVGDTHNNLFWDERTSTYVGITRLWDSGQRIVGRTESVDFERWTKAVEVVRALPEEQHRQTYTLLVFPYAGIYLGLLMLLGTLDDTVDCELAWSADTVRWQRVCPGTPLIPRGPRGSFDCGCIYAAAYPIARQGELQLYYGGGDDTHMSWRAGALGLARLRADGFAALEPVPGTETATIVTEPVVCAGSQLHVSADAEGGSLRVAVLDVDGLSLEACQRISADVTDGAVSWLGRQDLGALEGERIRLCFELRSAKLYAFSFAD